MKTFYRLDEYCTGIFERTSAIQKIGEVTRSYASIKLRRAGDYATFLCPEGISGNCVLEILELHQKESNVFYYQVTVNGVPVHDQTMEPLSDSLFPVWVKLSISPGDEIRITNQTDESVFIVGAGLHADLDALFREYLSPMEIGLCFPRPSYTDYAGDLSVFQKIQRDFSHFKNFRPAIGIEICYMNLSDDDLLHRFCWALSLAADADISLLFNFNTWWDATPTGRDGAGGYFSDAQYQQAVYDPLTGEVRLSIPNLWRNTPWYTMNSDTLNDARAKRLSRARQILTEASARQERPIQYCIFIDNEPTYWAEFAYTVSPDAGGDFSSAAIRAAIKDGVNLFPSGAVTKRQKEWLHRNHLTYMSGLARHFHAYSARETAILDESGAHYTDNFLCENTFTHIIPNSGYPIPFGKNPLYEQHVTKWARLGLECAGFQDERVLTYAAATGRFGQVNAERCCYTDPRFHLQFYTHGACTDIIFNYFYDTDIKHLAMLDEMTGEPMPVRSYGQTVCAFHACRDSLDAPCIASYENMAIAPLRERRVLRPKALGKGSLTMKVGNTRDYPCGGWIEITGLIRPENGSVTLSLGHAPDCAQIRMHVCERDADYQHIPLRMPLGDILKTPGDVYLKLEIESNYYDDWAQMNGVWEIRAIRALVSENSADQTFTLQEMRALSTHLSVRTDAMRLHEMHPEIPFSEKECLDHPKESYMRMMREISAVQTRAFLLRAPGKIDRFGVEVLECRGEGILIFPLSDARDAYLLGKPGSFARIRSKFGEKLLTAPNPEAPECFTGTFLRYDEETRCICASTHRLADWNFQPYLNFPCGKKVEVRIAADEICGDMLSHISANPYTPAAIVNARIDEKPTLESLKPGDKIELTFNNGAIVKIHATRGLTRGRMIDFQKMTLLPTAQNARLTLEIAPGRTVEFELGMNTHLNYVKAPAQNAMLAGMSDLKLEIGSTLLISFESETHPCGDHPLRATEITVV